MVDDGQPLVVDVEDIGIPGAGRIEVERLTKESHEKGLRSQRGKIRLSKVARGIGTGAKGIGKGIGFLAKGVKAVSGTPRREHTGARGYYDLLPEERDTWNIQHKIDTIRKKDELRSLKEQQKLMKKAMMESKGNFLDSVVSGNKNKPGLNLDFFGFKGEKGSPHKGRIAHILFGDLRKDRKPSGRKKTPAKKNNGKTNGGQSKMNYILFGKPRRK